MFWDRLAYMLRFIIPFLVILPLLCPAQESDKKPASFDKETAMALLDRYTGRWVGNYTLRNMAGEVLKELSADVTYTWKEDENGPVLAGRAVYGADGGMVVTESETFIANQQIFSVVKEGEKQRTYRGQIGQYGKSITWAPIDTDKPLDESFQESFGRDASGREILSSKSYENVTRNNISVLLTMNGLLFREPLESK